MTPRELLALAAGLILGAVFNSRREPCRRACCISDNARREAWRRGEEV